MKRKNRITPEAKLDISSASEYYFEINPDLAIDFVDKAAEIFGRIERSPEQFPVVHESGVRRGLFSRFPYMTIFSMESFENVILGVFHQSADPRKWEKRVE